MTEEVRYLTKIYVHENYDNYWLKHDIAMGKVNRPFKMDSFTNAICLPREQDGGVDNNANGKKLAQN